MAEAAPQGVGDCTLPPLTTQTSRSDQLRNRLFAIRHGESEANAQGLIVCDPAVGVKEYGLTERGQAQAKEACEKLKILLHPSHCLPEKILIVSSDFKRTRETAEILHDCLNVKHPIRFETALRERNFGQLHMTEDSNYSKVWETDVSDPTHTSFGSESVMNVVLRTTRLVQSLEDEFQDMIILLVSHGDTLQILSATFYGIGPNEHRTLPNLTPCAIRELVEREV